MPSKATEKKKAKRKTNININAINSPQIAVPGYFDTPEPLKNELVRTSGHFVDQILISDEKAKNLIKENNLTLDIFRDQNSELIKETLEIEDIGFRLTTSQHRVVNALRSLLFNKSENRDINSERFCMGNYFPKGEITQVFFNGCNLPAPHLLINASELYKETLGKEKYAGKDKKDIDNVLLSLSQQFFLMIYKQHLKQKKVKNGKCEEIINRITQYVPLFIFKRIDKGLSIKEDELLDKGILRNRDSLLLITFNPVWVDQIKTKSVQLPSQLNKLLINELGSWKKVTPSMEYLIYYLSALQAGAGKKSELQHEINEANLLEKLGLEKKYIKEKRQRKRAEKYLNDAIDICKKLGICISAEKTIGVKGQTKWIFMIPTYKKDMKSLTGLV